MPKRETPEQKFAKIFAMFTAGATEKERTTAEGRMDSWLKRHGKTRADIRAILVQAEKDDIAAQPSLPPFDPRDTASHPFDDPAFTPAGLVEDILKIYVWMPWYAAVIYSLWICFTHVRTRFAIAPRIALVSEKPDSGKTTALEVGRNLVLRPNPEALGTAAAIRDFLDEGPGTVLLDELDHVDAEARKKLQTMWNLGHRRGAQTSLLVGGKRKLFRIDAPMLAAGVGSFLAPTQKDRTFVLEMTPYDAETKPEREYDDQDVDDLNAVYSFLHHWAAKAKLNPKPPLPPGVMRRFAGNVLGLLAIADSCGPDWGRRAREAVVFLLAKEKAELPQNIMVRHGLLIFEALELDQIKSIEFNKELRRLDLPDARWTRYRGAGGGEYAHPIELFEQSALLMMVGIESERIRPAGEKQGRGYKLAAFKDAARKHNITMPDDAEPGRGHLRLIKPQSD